MHALTILISIPHSLLVWSQKKHQRLILQKEDNLVRELHSPSSHSCSCYSPNISQRWQSTCEKRHSDLLLSQLQDLFQTCVQNKNFISNSNSYKIHTKYTTTFWQNSDKSQMWSYTFIRSMLPLLKIVCRVVNNMNTYDFPGAKTTPWKYKAIPGFNPPGIGPE